MKATVSITDIPEVLHGMRREMADILREVAADEHPQVRRRLLQVADAFECGQGVGDGD